MSDWTGDTYDLDLEDGKVWVSGNWSAWKCPECGALCIDCGGERVIRQCLHEAVQP